MHFLIVGAGLAGLSTYLHLQKRLPPGHKVTILEKHDSQDYRQDDSPSTFNGGLGIAPNGMRILRRLDRDLYSSIERAGYKVESFEFRTAGGWHLATWPAASSKEPSLGTVIIDRKTLWKILRRQVPDEAISQGVSVVKVRADGTVLLDDGDSIKADFVIGADGVRSVVRMSVIDEGEPGRDPIFQGLMNVGGFVPTGHIRKACNPKHSMATMTFGSTGFVGYSPMSTDARHNIDGKEAAVAGEGSIWWATYTDEPSEANRKTTNSPTDERLRTAMRDRHGDWSDPAIQQIISDLDEATSASVSGDHPKASLDLHTPTWILPKLPRWIRGRIFLIGDAAHALPSTSGQGVSQAFEDSAMLSLFIAEATKTVTTDSSEEPVFDKLADLVSELYVSFRKSRVERLLDDALRSQNNKRNLSWSEKMIMYFILWLIGRIGGGRQEEWKYDYDGEALYDRICKASAHEAPAKSS